MVYRWALVVFLAILSAALMAGPNFGKFLIYLTGLLLLGFVLRKLENAKKLKGERRQDND